MRVRAQPELVELGRPLVVEPGLDEVIGEHASLGEERVVALQDAENFLQRAGDLRDGGRLVRRQRTAGGRCASRPPGIRDTYWLPVRFTPDGEN